MSRAVGQLEKMYNTLNADFFGGALPTPIITVQSKPGTWGHCTVGRVWKRKETDTYEMNVSAEVLDREIEEIIDTLLHEMIHLYCRENDIHETSRGGTYHNNKFRALAEKCGLVCYKTEKHGWNTQGAGNDKLTEYAYDHGWSEIMISRSIGRPLQIGAGGLHNGGTSLPLPGEKRPSSTRKLQCPKCGCSVRATRDVRILCMDCMTQMFEI